MLKALPKGRTTEEIGATADIPYTLVEVATENYGRFIASFRQHFPDQEIASTWEEFTKEWAKPAKDEDALEVYVAGMDTWLWRTTEDEDATPILDEDKVRAWAEDLGWAPSIFYTIKPVTMHENMVLTGWHSEAYKDAEGKRQVRADGAAMGWDLVRLALLSLRGLKDPDTGEDVRLIHTKEGKPGSRLRLLTHESLERVPPLLFRELSKAAAGSTTIAQSIKKDVVFGSASQPALKAEVPTVE